MNLKQFILKNHHAVQNHVLKSTGLMGKTGETALKNFITDTYNKVGT